MPDPTIITQHGLIIEMYDGKPLTAMRPTGEVAFIEEVVDEGAEATRQVSLWEPIKDACRALVQQHLEYCGEKSVGTDNATGILYRQNRKQVDHAKAYAAAVLTLQSAPPERLLAVAEALLGAVASFDREGLQKAVQLFERQGLSGYQWEEPLIKEVPVKYVRFHEIPKVFVADV